MPEVRCFLSLKDGTVIKLPPGDPAMATVHSAKDEFIQVETIPSRIQYQWVDEFAKTIEDETLRSRVEAAINGKGAFRRFKDILLTIPDERRRWFEYRDIKMRERIMDWVQENGVQPLNVPPWDEDEDTPAPTVVNNTHDVEAVRDTLIAWFDGKDATSTGPLELEVLAAHLCESFIIKPKG
ncbi:MAG: hypothetical protein A2289_22825 [Deltaproteobacteria bacterium RIFOXYA12_FULL_58_15]|nr:MAG: hypothetical protein A2289_22825 [Deltaproteobacteria bacterium RIFOXYA12_FULL_58_15]